MQPRAEERDEARGIYVVKKGDTLLRIALDHGQNYRDILLWNNLPDPNDIKVDQVLRIAPPARRQRRDDRAGDGARDRPAGAGAAEKGDAARREETVQRQPPWPK